MGVIGYRKPLEERIFGGISVTGDDCWLSPVKKQIRGYGRITIEGRQCFVHRVAYELRIGSIPPGLTIDHLCNVRLCVNPDHMEPVTAQENTRRQWMRRQYTYCKRGHEFIAANIAPNGPRNRTCRECRNARARAV